MIANFVDRFANRTDYEKISSAAGANHHQLPESRDQLSTFFAANNGSPVVIVAHLEGGRIMMQKEGFRKEEWPSYEIKQVLDLAIQYRVNLLFLSCRAGTLSNIPGPTVDLWTPEIVERIERVRDAATFGDLLEALGGRETPFAINSADVAASIFAIDFIAKIATSTGELFQYPGHFGTPIPAPSTAPVPAVSPSPVTFIPDDGPLATLLRWIGSFFTLIGGLLMLAFGLVLGFLGLLAIVSPLILVAGFIDHLFKPTLVAPHSGKDEALNSLLSPDDRALIDRIRREHIAPWDSEIEAIENAAAKGVVDARTAHHSLTILLSRAQGVLGSRTSENKGAFPPVRRPQTTLPTQPYRITLNGLATDPNKKPPFHLTNIKGPT
ncbi:hypothetical protein TSA1_25645 [Bradyrhizobium nitroreducens]|uniref:Uncharacterized protein n=1 Tax=Bradyrhizobium nitroreducens TaxID=709803 RepID=A0A2M6UGV2_9BRAD|nr:hypothetical protein TSA1_25645 [Bradyrhizobium nitroreducens]